jgi:hypothetical protein
MIESREDRPWQHLQQHQRNKYLHRPGTDNCSFATYQQCIIEIRKARLRIIELTR